VKINKILFFGLTVCILLQPSLFSDAGNSSPNILGQEQAYTKPVPPKLPVVTPLEYNINPNIFSNLSAGIHLMGTSVDIENINLFKYVDNIYLYNKLENKYIVKDAKIDKDINIKAYNGFYIYNRVGDKYNISFALSKPKCINLILPTPPAPPIVDNNNTNIENLLPEVDEEDKQESNSLLPRILIVKSKIPKCPTLKNKLSAIKEGWSLIGSSEEILDTKEMFKDVKYVYMLETNGDINNFVDIQKDNIAIKSNSGFWVYK